MIDTANRGLINHSHHDTRTVFIMPPPIKFSTLARNPCTKLTVDEIQESRNDKLYEHAMSVKNTGDIPKIADSLVKIANSEYERAKLVYMWLGENLKYDLAACRTGKIPSQSAEAVLKSGKSVCAGFSTLAKQIGLRAGLNIFEIEGYAKQGRLFLACHKIIETAKKS